MKNIFKILLITSFVILYNGCSTKEFKLDNENKIEPLDVLYQDKLNVCNSKNKNIHLNINFKDDFINPIEYLRNEKLGSNYSWVEAKYHGNFKKDFEHIIKLQLGKLCNYSFNPNQKGENINLFINKLKVVPIDGKIEDSYFIPIVATAKDIYYFKKDYLYDITLSGDLFLQDIQINKKFHYVKHFGFKKGFFTMDFSNNITFINEDDEIFNFNGKSSMTLPVSANGEHTLKFKTLDNKLYREENFKTNGSVYSSHDEFLLTNNNYISELFLIDKATFSAFPKHSNYFSGPFTYIVYDIINEIIIKTNKSIKRN